MESILEKITLYDILGYFVPGMLFLILSGSEYVMKACVNEVEIWKDYKSLSLICIIVVAFACGCALSEISRWICNCISKKGDDKLIEQVQFKQLILALEKSGKISNETSEDNIKDDLMSKYFTIIYSDIQADKNYNRIHNYASTVDLNKNLSIAFFLGDIFHILTICLLSKIYGIYSDLPQEIIFNILILFMSVVFFIRYLRFEKKKKRYAIEWYINKYTTK